MKLRNKKLLLVLSSAFVATEVGLFVGLSSSNSNVGIKEKDHSKSDARINSVITEMFEAKDRDEVKIILERIFAQPGSDQDNSHSKRTTLIANLSQYIFDEKDNLKVKAYTKNIDGVERTILVFNNLNTTEVQRGPSKHDKKSFDKKMLEKKMYREKHNWTYMDPEFEDLIKDADFGLLCIKNHEHKLYSSKLVSSADNDKQVPKEVDADLDYVTYEARLMLGITFLEEDDINIDMLTGSGSKKATDITCDDVVSAIPILKDANEHYNNFLKEKLTIHAILTPMGDTSLKIEISFHGIEKTFIINNFKSIDAASPHEIVSSVKEYFDELTLYANKKTVNKWTNGQVIDKEQINAVIRNQDLNFSNEVTVTFVVEDSQETYANLKITITSKENSSISLTTIIRVDGFVNQAFVDASKITESGVLAAIIAIKEVSGSASKYAMPTSVNVNGFKVSIENAIPSDSLGAISFDFIIKKSENPIITKDLNKQNGVLTGFTSNDQIQKIITDINELLRNTPEILVNDHSIKPSDYTGAEFETKLKEVIGNQLPDGVTYVISRGKEGNGSVEFIVQISIPTGESSDQFTIIAKGLKNKAEIANELLTSEWDKIVNGLGITEDTVVLQNKPNMVDVGDETTLGTLARWLDKATPRIDARISVVISVVQDKKLGELSITIEATTANATTRSKTFIVSGYKTEVEEDYDNLNAAYIAEKVKDIFSWDSNVDPSIYKNDHKDDFNNLSIKVGTTTFTVSLVLGDVDLINGTIDFVATIKVDHNVIGNINGVLASFKTSLSAETMKNNVQNALANYVANKFDYNDHDVSARSVTNTRQNAEMIYNKMISQLNEFSDYGATKTFEIYSQDDTDGQLTFKIIFEFTDMSNNKQTLEVIIIVEGYLSTDEQILSKQADLRNEMDGFLINNYDEGVSNSAADGAWLKARADAKELINGAKDVADADYKYNIALANVKAALTIYNQAITDTNDHHEINNINHVDLRLPAASDDTLPSNIPAVADFDLNGVHIKFTKWEQNNETGEIVWSVKLTKGTQERTIEDQTISGFQTTDQHNQEKAYEEASKFPPASHFETDKTIIDAVSNVPFEDGKYGIALPDGITGVVTYSILDNREFDGFMDVIIRITIGNKFAEHKITVNVVGINKAKADEAILEDQKLFDDFQSTVPSKTGMPTVGDEFDTSILNNLVPAGAGEVNRYFKIIAFDPDKGEATIEVTFTYHIRDSVGTTRHATFKVTGFITKSQINDHIKSITFGDVLAAIRKAIIPNGVENTTVDEAIANRPSDNIYVIDGVKFKITVGKVGDNEIFWSLSEVLSEYASQEAKDSKTRLSGHIGGFKVPSTASLENIYN